jgi:ribonuclease PH
MIDAEPLLDLDYSEDSGAGVDFNVVMLGTGQLVEVQGTAEGEPFSRKQMDVLIDLAEAGIRQLFTLQRDALNEWKAATR